MASDDVFVSDDEEVVISGSDNVTTDWNVHYRIQRIPSLFVPIQVWAFFTGASPFSNFHPTPRLYIDGQHYPTLEHFYQAAKARFFKQPLLAERIRCAQSPAMAKLLGKQVKDFCHVSWTPHSIRVMRRGIYHKFLDPVLRSKLLQTTGLLLVEANRWDCFWSVGLPLNSASLGDPCSWRGQNHLGFLLTEHRQRLEVDSL
jgi:ribA/ribD-fused uncharacterized protein